jgi:hypothetical protein
MYIQVKLKVKKVGKQDTIFTPNTPMNEEDEKK